MVGPGDTSSLVHSPPINKFNQVCTSQATFNQASQCRSITLVTDPTIALRAHMEGKHMQCAHTLARDPGPERVTLSDMLPTTRRARVSPVNPNNT